WIGSSNTLLFTSGERIEFISKACGKAMGNIRAVLSDRAGNTWASTNEGVIRFYSDSSGANICDKPLDGTPYQDYKIVSMYMDAYDRIWLGTFDHGVLIFDPVKHVFKQLKESDGLLNNNVMSITGTGNTIWLGTLGGVSGCYFPVDSGKTKPKFFTLPGNGSGNNFIYKVYEDSKHRLLTGTDGQGVGIYDGRLFNNYGTEHGLKSGIIYSLTEDFKGRIWAAAAEGGLYCFDGTSIKNYNRSKGLSDLSIAALSTDESGNIVIVNKSGIDVMDPENGHIITLGQELGVNTIDPDLNCISKDVYGNTWIGSQNGIIKIRLGESASMFRPLLRLRHVLCFLEPVDTSVEKKFSHSRNHISFDYSGIWYDNPNAVTFRYLLEGYNTGWVDTRDRFVTFPNLVPGNYTFRLKCALNNNFTDADEVSYSFVIALPFWRESWFLIFITVVITILLIFYLRFRDNRTRSLESLNRERIQAQFEVLKNQVNPHFLFNSFNTLITIIEDDPAKAINYVNKLSDFFRRILTHKEKDVIPLPQELGLLNDYLFLQKQRHGDAFIMEMRLPDKKTLEKYSLPPLSLQMLVENAFKHNAVKLSSPLRIEIFMNDDGNIVIRNNKISRMKSEPSTSTGLTNLKNRYKLLCGQEPVIHDNFDSFTVILPAIKS
ncbi:MAG TPA: histidine kinase, partial [Bacteroidia bacterium]|nr:histidine kinase [Bacteroidia bacterium]